MDFLPVFLNMRGRRALIVGGGVIAARKAALVQSAHPDITVVSPVVKPAMAELAAQHDFVVFRRQFEDADLDGVSLVIAATDDEAVNQSVYRAAERRRIPVNVADQPELCSFILPSIVDRSPAIVAVSTGGRSPVLARYMKSWLEQRLPFGLASFTQLLGEYRERVKQALADTTQRRRFWDRIIDGPIGDLALNGRSDAARGAIENALTDWDSSRAARGCVYLIGAGPGDPELMTLRGLRLLQRADVVLYDRLIPTALLQLCRREAELIYVGKQARSHVVSQQTIGEMLVERAGRGQIVARLKGGDPFVFGRGGEELEALATAGVDFQVVPGVSAANGCAAYAGVPLTHRDHATGVSFWTGHMKDGELDLPWAKMVPTHHTQVIFMGLRSLPVVAQRMIEHGTAATTPAAVISAGTTVAQRVVVAPLADLPGAAANAELPSPALVIIGDVVGLREQLNWHGSEMVTELVGGAEFPFPSHID